MFLEVACVLEKASPATFLTINSTRQGVGHTFLLLCLPTNGESKWTIRTKRVTRPWHVASFSQYPPAFTALHFHGTLIIIAYSKCSLTGIRTQTVVSKNFITAHTPKHPMSKYHDLFNTDMATNHWQKSLFFILSL